MKHNLSLLTLSTLIGFSACHSATEQTKTPLQIDWEVGDQTPGQKTYTNKIHLINTSDQSIDSSWVLNLCFFPKKFQLAQDAPIDIKQISGTYYQMTPSKQYQALAAGDTLTIEWQTKSRHTTTSFAPQSAYLVRKEGADSSKYEVNVQVLHEKDNTDLSSAIYKENNHYHYGKTLTSNELIPSIKLVQPQEGVLSHNLCFTLVAEQGLDMEKHLLQKQLRALTSQQTANDINPCPIRLQIDPSLSDNPEAYRLEVLPDQIILTGQSAAGVFYASQTLYSMLMHEHNTLPLQTLVDYPDMAYRGMMIDVARNFTSKEHILQLIDLFAFYKINTLHLHLTDDEGWRIEIDGLEQLHQMASHRGEANQAPALQPAYFAHWDANDANQSGNGYYSKDDFIEIIRYAKARHINVIPEVDLPGHARAAIKAMQERYKQLINTDAEAAEAYLLTAADDQSSYVSVQGYRDNVIDVSLPSTYRFIDKVMLEIKNIYQEAGCTLEALHIGGDEVPHGTWGGSPSCQRLMETEGIEKVVDLKRYFVKQVAAIAQKHAIRLAGWQEVALKSNGYETDPSLAHANILSYCWNVYPFRNLDEVPYRLANENQEVILCNAPNFYFDFAYTPSFDEPGHAWGGFVDEWASFDMQPHNLYLSSRKKDASGSRLSSTPRAHRTELQQQAHKNIVGVQGQIWSETVRNFDALTYYLFPKMFGLVERGWNANPEWIQTQAQADYDKALQHFTAKVYQCEIPKLHKMGIQARVPAPGIQVIDQQLYLNCRDSKATIHYTTNGAEPTADDAQWHGPVSCALPLIKAKAFSNGVASKTSTYKQLQD